MKKVLFKSLTVLCFALLCCGISCEDMAGVNWFVRVANNSDKDVYFVLSFDERNGNFYPTTEWPPEPTTVGSDIHLFKPHTSRKITYPSQDMKFNSNDRIAIFVFDPDTIARYSWEQLKIDQNYLKKYECTRAELHEGLVYP